MRTFAVLLCACLLVPGAWAGTSSEPEITDSTADVETSAGAPACAPVGCQSAANFIDLVGVWVDQTDEKVLFHIQVTGNHNANAYGAAQYMVFFSLGGTSYEAGFDAGRSSTTGGDDSETPVGVADAASFQSDHVLVEVPLEAIGAGSGGTLTEFYARTTLDTADETDDSLVDRAPDSGFGDDFTIQSATPETVAQYLNITEGPLEHTFQANASTDAAFVINWTGPAHASMDLQVEGNGTVTVTMFDPTGAVRFECACSDGTNESQSFESEAGNWQALLNYTGFAGNASLRLHETLPADPVDEPDEPVGEPSDNATGNETATGQDSPLPWIPALLGLAGAAWVRRRRS